MLPVERECRWCGKAFTAKTKNDNARKHCSPDCAKKADVQRQANWRAAHPDSMKKYNENRLAKNPRFWVAKSRQARLDILALLGGKCIVRGCDVTNPFWLHVDYIPTCRGEKVRHPRHIAYIRANKSKFRLLCANHHYELTLTGRIKGTRITQ